MNMEIARSRTTNRRWLALGLAMVLVLAIAAPVSAKSNVTRQLVSGDSVPADCNPGEGAGSLYMTGDIDGCLTFYPERYSCDDLNGFERYREWGSESFTGTLNGEAGEFTTTYFLEATYAPGFCDALDEGIFAWELQLTGGCKHRITGTSGSFDGVTGLLTFFDVIPDPGVSGASNFIYAAELKKS